MFLIVCAALLCLVAALFTVKRFLVQERQILLSEIERSPQRRSTMNTSAPEVAIRLAGVLQNKEGTDLVLRFENGLFDRGVSLSPRAEKLLTALGRQIEPYWSHVTLIIVGHTDDVPITNRFRFPDNESLAVARADAVVRHIGKTTRVPEYAWRIQHNTRSSPLYPNDSSVSRLRNRTVEIRVAPRVGSPP